MSLDGTRYYGKYRGTVVNNVDPLQVDRRAEHLPGCNMAFRPQHRSATLQA